MWVTGGRLPPWIVQIAGLVVIGVALATWIDTGRETSYFIGAGLIMIGVGTPIANLFNDSTERRRNKEEDEEN